MSEDNEEDKQDARELFLSDDAIFALVSTLATEVIRYGEEESKLIENKHLSENEVVGVMKANTLLTVFAMLLVRVVESKDIEGATSIVNCWISPAVQDLVQIAFSEEIEEAANIVTGGIDRLEKDINKENNDSQSQPGD